ncbi:protein EXECUTER 2, chloroplastic [Cicer arietinum]|uniref:Protein EXECUTER 2, chloroplastic n=1 Tax=Cicer arietinum TaxID=3827 RepID=A0A1S2YAH4_CICAR|nr:protein EXECUTER 2, chloroplastic [Cicer arietinum]
MVMASLGVSQAIFFSNTNTTATPSRFNLLPNKPPTHLLGSPFSLQTNPSSISIFSRRNRTHLFRCTPNSNNTSLNWDWNRWCRHFSDIEQAETFASLLKFQLEDAVEKEEFQEAAKLKRAIVDATSKDSVAEIMSQLKNAIDDERYHDASRLCRYTGSGLVGWWVGYSKNSDDPFGRLIHISPGMGRFVGKSYSPRQLLTASTGTPIFEIYVVKNADDTYHMQVVYLRRAKGNSMSNPPSIPAKSPSKPEVENLSSVEVQEPEEKVEERNDEKNSNVEAATEDGIKSVINFLKEKIPGLKVKVMNINVEEEAAQGSDSIKQIMEEDSNKTSSTENSEGGVNNLDEPDEEILEGDGDASEDEKDLDMKMFIGGIVHNNEDTAAKEEFIRLPAEIKNMERDSFLLHIPKRNLDNDRREDKVRNIKVAALAAQGISELMPSDVAKAFWSSDKVSSKISKSMREIVKLAINQAQKKRLSEDTYFSRITSSKGDFDPFDGLYVGAFGPYGIEIVQLRRKFGHWNDVDNEGNTSNIEFFEYVEAVKLTGDLNVPAGQVTFRAKIGKVNRNANRGLYPDELGVNASYKGQGRIADFGFRNPKWVDGELLQLNGKGLGPHMKGADLGFLYVVPEQSFLVLFNRLKLPE